ncbi:hypothetical protein HDE_08197 [Halotydeus destructor]|nr:hypothetical protein HDE_08197 [Halotydeus destructor]
MSTDDIRLFESEIRQACSKYNEQYDMIKKMAGELSETDELFKSSLRLEHADDLKKFVSDLSQTKQSMMEYTSAFKEFTEEILSREVEDIDLATLGAEFDSVVANVKQPYNPARDLNMNQLITLLRLNYVEDDLVEMESERTVIPKDSYTQRPIEDPVRNKVCGHTYDRQGIKSYFDTKPNPRCPVVGCSNRHINFEQLEDDLEMRSLIARLKNLPGTSAQL